MSNNRIFFYAIIRKAADGAAGGQVFNITQYHADKIKISFHFLSCYVVAATHKKSTN